MSRFLCPLLALCCAAVLFAADLPITNVVLFSSGVGYFQRTGSVRDNDSVNMSFKTTQINDLLKSMVMLDLDGGQVGAVTYGAKDPISKTLESFAINIADNPSIGKLLNRLRGVGIEVETSSKVTGKILGVETKQKEVEKEKLTYESLNLLTDKGIRSVRLDDISSFTLLDDRLNKELQDALQTLASGLDNQRKPVVVSFNGKKNRRVLIGYLIETPIWKTSYRLVSDNKGSLLQGWGIVENSSDDDWANVRLSLVSGRPISFIQDLYTPLYIHRPVVQPQLYASIGPVTYSGAVNGDIATMGKMAGPAGPPGRIAPGEEMMMPPSPSMDYYDGYGRSTESMRDDLTASVVSAALARDLGQGFEYAIKEPINLPRQQSAMIPIVTSPVETTKVSIYNVNVNTKYPLYGMKLKNTTGVNLMGGPITVYDNNVYAGDATFENLQPGEQRLISYAVDLGVTPDRKENYAPQKITSIKLFKGEMTLTQKSRKTVSYSFLPKDGKDRRVIVEHAFNPGWTLVAPKKADEKTDSLYRFDVPVDKTKGGVLDVVEERIDSQIIALTSLDTNTLLVYAANGSAGKKVSEALKKAAELNRKVLDTQQERAKRENEIQTITLEQDRIRQNMETLDQDSDLYKRLVKKLDEQETRIEKLRGEIYELQTLEESQRKEFEDYVNSLDLSEDM